MFRIAREELVESGLYKVAEVGYHLAALGADGVGLVEDRGDAALLVERWKWDHKVI